MSPASTRRAAIVKDKNERPRNREFSDVLTEGLGWMQDYVSKTLKSFVAANNTTNGPAGVHLIVTHTLGKETYRLA